MRTLNEVSAAARKSIPRWVWIVSAFLGAGVVGAIVRDVASDAQRRADDAKMDARVAAEKASNERIAFDSITKLEGLVTLGIIEDANPTTGVILVRRERWIPSRTADKDAIIQLLHNYRVATTNHGTVTVRGISGVEVLATCDEWGQIDIRR